MRSSIKKDWGTTKKEILESGEYSNELWHLVEKFAESILVSGRPDFDLPHTHGVVSWAFILGVAFNKQVEKREIKGQKKIDITVLLTAAWLHDIGYYGQFEGIADYKTVHDKKALHMIVGAKMAQEFLREHAAHLLSLNQIEQVVHLISIHDQLDKIQTMIEILLVESDTLGMMDVDWVKPTYKGKEALSFPSKDKTIQRFRLFKTKLARAVLPQIIQKFEKFVIERDFKGKDPRVKV